MGFVFVSYSRKDADVVNTIVSHLKDDGFEVWIDRENIKGGDPWRKQIVRAIHTTDAFVLMLSRSSVASENVRKEVDVAENAKRKLFPVQLELVEIPEDLEYQLAGTQWIEYHGNPETKYQELVEVLQNHQRTLQEAFLAETRQAEFVIDGVDVKNFGPKEREQLLNFLAQITNTPRTKLRLVNIVAGSVHVFINMPADAAYALKTAALNRDRGLIQQRITAMKLDGEEKYVLVESGELGFPKPKPRRPILGLFLLGLLGVAVLAAILLGGFRLLSPLIQPATFTQTLTITSTKTPSLTPSKTPTPTSTVTLTPTTTPTPTPPLVAVIVSPESITTVAPFPITPPTPFPTTPVTPFVVTIITPNSPPPPPSMDVKAERWNQDMVVCNPPQPYIVEFLWNEPYDASGIQSYEVQLQAFIQNQWVTIANANVPSPQLELDITSKVNDASTCGTDFMGTIRAMDGEGAWSDWSPGIKFATIENPG